MLRQITESVLINKVDKGKLINSKNQWNFVHIPRAVVTLYQAAIFHVLLHEASVFSIFFYLPSTDEVIRRI